MGLNSIVSTILITPIFELLKFFTSISGNFGVGIILLTLTVRGVVAPLSFPMMKSQKKMRALQPELNKLKQKHKSNPQALQQAQMELYKKHDINVFAGCLPQILQLVVLFALYGVLSSFVARAREQGVDVNTMFLGIDLSKADTTRVIPVLATISQLFLSLMILPGKERHDLVPNSSKVVKLKKLNEQEEKTQEMSEQMQRQMVFILPLMTGWAALSFPAGLGLYWIMTTIFSIVQQWIVTGPGGLIDAKESIVRVLSKLKGV